ncbi:GTP-binding protein Era/DNA repair protein RecO [Pantoea anthophila]|nr:GTP-binding protein Era/DNA repair protein RecO [Pantoea anthophila]
MSENVTYCGFVAIVGRPNVGKSTLLNQLLGQKVSITSRKPQTTRHRIMGIHTEGEYQAIYVDTPGLHMEEKRAINRLMNRAASSSIGDVELVIFVVEGTRWTPDDEMVLGKLRDGKVPVVLAINKVDNIQDKSVLLPHLQFLSQQMNFLDIVPISAESGKNVDTIAAITRKHLPQADHHFPEDYITDRSQRFMASEIIREKLMRFLGAELPYSVTVEIERFVSNERGGYDINGLILVEREGQKKMVIGNKGAKIKTIGTEARRDMEEMFEAKVHLELWVKVKSGAGQMTNVLCAAWVIQTTSDLMEGWQRAFVLHSRPFSETSLLLDLFSENEGRVRVLAKGARSRRSQLKGALQPFTPLLVRWSGRGEVKTLRNAEAVSLALPLSGITLYCGLYVNELVSRVLQQESPFQELFFDYLHCLQALASTHGKPEPALRRFELALLGHLGYGVDFLHCAGSGEPITDNMTYSYREERGFIASLVLNQRSFTGRELRALYERDFPDAESLRAAKRFTRIALKPYLGGKPLKSQELFRQFIPKKKPEQTDE